MEVEAQVGRAIEEMERSLLYKPVLFASGRVHFIDQRRKVEDKEAYAVINPVAEQLGPVLWDKAIQLSEADPSRLYSIVPEDGACFEQLPEGINEAAEISAAKKELEEHLQPLW